MKILLISTISLLVSITSLAQSYQRIELESQEIARTLKEEARFLTQDQILKISKKLESIRNIINNTSDPSDYAEYTCVSRDNDGRNPYVLGYRNGVDVIRIAGGVYTSKEECQSTLRDARQIRRRTFLCVSRDNDGRSPFQLSVLEQANLNKIPNSVTSNKQMCLQSLNELKSQGQNVIFCASRDNDGRSPYVAASLSLIDFSFKKGSEVFSDISSCKEFLNGGRR